MLAILHHQSRQLEKPDLTVDPNEQKDRKYFTINQIPLKDTPTTKIWETSRYDNTYPHWPNSLLIYGGAENQLVVGWFEGWL